MRLHNYTTCLEMLTDVSPSSGIALKTGSLRALFSTFENHAEQRSTLNP